MRDIIPIQFFKPLTLGTRRTEIMYVKKTIIYGNRIEERKYHTRRFRPKDGKRQRREKITPEKIQENNERNSVRNLYRLLVGNFSSEDYHVVLTYGESDRPDPEGAKERLKKLFAKLRKWFRKQGGELKFIAVTEWMKKKVHHHVVISGIDGLARALRKLWMGGVHMEPLFENKDFQGLAEYLVKETKKSFRQQGSPIRQRYTHSRNLKKPIEKIKVIDAESWREDIVVPRRFRDAGYLLDKSSVVSGFDFFGYPFLEYQFVRYLEDENAVV